MKTFRIKRVEGCLIEKARLYCLKKGKGYMVWKKGKNKYAAHAKISNASFRAVAKLFANDLGAIEIAKQTGLNRNTVNRYTLALRRRIIECDGGINLNDYTDVTVLVFGVSADGNRITVDPLDISQGHAIRSLLMNGDQGGGDGYLQRCRQYDGVISIERSLRIYLNFGKVMLTSQSDSLTMTEDFFAYVKERISKFYGISKKHFLVHLKECEFRYNRQSEDIYQLIIQTAKEKPLFLERYI